MNKLSTAARDGHAGIHWNEDPTKFPEKSGLYITRDEKNQSWYKYFETNYGEWYMSWAELKANVPRQAAKLGPSDVPMHVVAWADHRPRKVV